MLSICDVQDRLCIASNGAFTKQLSAQDTTSCCDILKCFSMCVCSGPRLLPSRTSHPIGRTGEEYSCARFADLVLSFVVVVVVLDAHHARSLTATSLFL